MLAISCPVVPAVLPASLCKPVQWVRNRALQRYTRDNCWVSLNASRCTFVTPNLTVSSNLGQHGFHQSLLQRTCELQACYNQQDVSNLGKLFSSIPRFFCNRGRWAILRNYRHDQASATARKASQTKWKIFWPLLSAFSAARELSGVLKRILQRTVELQQHDRVQ